MTTTKEILKEAQTDISAAIGIVNQAMRLVGILAENGQADSALAEFYLRVSYELVESMKETASTAVAKIQRHEVKRDLTILRGELAGLRTRISLGQ